MLELTPSQPIQIDGQIYDKYVANLIVSTTYHPNGQQDCSVVWQLIPAYIGGNGLVAATEYAKSIRLGTLDGADQQTIETVIVIQQALQNYINEKGL